MSSSSLSSCPTITPSQVLLDQFINFNSYPMTIIWLCFSLLGIWAHAFKQYRWSKWLHGVSMGIVILVVFLATVFAAFIIPSSGVTDQFHRILGKILIAGVLIQGLCGCITWTLQTSSKINPVIVYYSNIIHNILGYIILILIGIFILKQTYNFDKYFFWPVLIINIVSYISFFLYKLFNPLMQKYNSLKLNTKNIPIIKYSRDLARYHRNYFIFSDKVYSLDNVITSHPGGYEVINHIRSRNVDRYIFGSQPLETLDSVKGHCHCHTAASIRMAGQPIGIIYNFSPYLNIQQTNEVYLQKLSTPCKNKHIYVPYLASKSNPFIFNGYEDISQLGRYIALTIDNTITRLYGCVNFLHESNLQLMSRITGQSQQPIIASDNQATIIDIIPANSTLQQHSNTMPLCIKKYDKGKFTQQFLSGTYTKSIKISHPRGRGLLLQQLPPGRLIFLTGGTGHFPFCDTFDLLCKQLLIANNHPLSHQIKQKNPLAAKKLLTSKFTFTLLLSVPDILDLHQIILFQLNQMATYGAMTVKMRTHKNLEYLAKNYPGIQIIDKRFQHYLPELVSSINDISQIYICGPPTMKTEIIKNMDVLNVPLEKYSIL